LLTNNLSLDGESKTSSTSTQTQDISEQPQDIANHHHKEVDTSRQGDTAKQVTSYQQGVLPSQVTKKKYKGR